LAARHEERNPGKRNLEIKRIVKSRLKFAAAVLAFASYAGVCGFASGQQAHPDRPPQAQTHPAQSHPPARPQTQNSYRPPVNPQVQHPLQNPNSPPRNHFNAAPGARTGSGANFSPRQQLGVGSARPWVDQMRSLSPQQRDRVLQNSRAFQNLSPEKQNKIRQQFSQWDRMSPQQQDSLRQNENIWRGLSPEQQQHIKNDVLPRWRQMPWDRQQMLKQKLGVLQNMPESARNQRLNDPNFTSGMNEDEKSMLHDLSHTHLGGISDSPQQ
jgi:hypothetical protein